MSFGRSAVHWREVASVSLTIESLRCVYHSGVLRPPLGTNDIGLLVNVSDACVTFILSGGRQTPERRI